MSSLFNEPGGSTSSFMSDLGKTDKKMMLLYVLGGLIVVVAVLMVANVKLNFLPSYLDPRPAKNKTEANASLYWKPGAAYTFLQVSESEAPQQYKDDRYSMLVDMVWYNTRTWNSDGPYRHILHKGSDELRSLTDVSPLAVFTKASCAAGAQYGALPANGLPKRMNPGIFADPVTNDILVFIDTEYDGKHLRESLRIPDIPLDIPFRLAVIVQDKYVEVYIDCRLEVTKVLKGMPVKVDPEWYGLSGRAALTAQIQNLKVWTSALTSNDIRPLCPMPIIFKEKRPICPEQTAEPEKVPPQSFPSATAVSYGKSLQCN